MAFLVTVAPGTVVTGPEEVYGFGTSAISTVLAGITVTAVSGTSPSLQAYLEVQGSDGQWYQVWKPSAITAAGQTFGTVGPGESNGAVLGAQARLRFEVSGTTPSFTLSASVIGR